MRKVPRPALLAAIALLTVACTGTAGASPTPGSSATSAPTMTASPSPSPMADANVAIVRIETVGGFMPPQMILRRYPEVVLYGDGRLILQGAQTELYPGPALPRLVVSQLTQHGIEQVLEWAKEAGLFGPDRVLGQMIPDAGVTNYTIVYPSGTHTTSMGPGTPGTPDPAIGAVQQFEQVLLNIRDWLPDDVVGDDAPYAFDRLWVIASPTDPLNPPDPPQAAKDWPLESLATIGAPMSFGDNYRCVVIDGDDLARLLPVLADATESTPWRSNDQLYQLLFHPMLPDDEGCPSL